VAIQIHSSSDNFHLSFTIIEGSILLHLGALRHMKLTFPLTLPYCFINFGKGGILQKIKPTLLFVTKPEYIYFSIMKCVSNEKIQTTNKKCKGSADIAREMNIVSYRHAENCALLSYGIGLFRTLERRAKRNTCRDRFSLLALSRCSLCVSLLALCVVSLAAHRSPFFN
jgi:hypothetical protein